MPQSNYKPNVEDAGIVAEQVTMSGQYVAGRDITIDEKIYTQAKFSEINLEPYGQNGNYISPMFTQYLLARVLGNRLLLIGGYFEFYKNDLIRHLAALIFKERGLKAREWVERTGGANPVTALAEEKKPTVFLLPSTSPQDIHYDLRRIANIAETGHFILVSTDLSEHAWKLSNDVKSSYWFEVPQENIYYPEDLTHCLIQELEKAGNQISFENKVERLYPKTELVQGGAIEELATELETVDKIQIFVKLLMIEQSTIDKAKLEKLLNNTINNKRHLLTNWFRTLDDKEKETAIALSLFNGLYDDQFFEATEQVVKRAWEERHTHLKSLDYCDLDNLFNFFNVQTVDSNRRLVNSKFPNQRLEFFQAIWFSHRRRLLAALPVLESLINDAENIEAYSWELYGTKERKERLLQVVSEVLSDLSILHLEVVEPNLLQLATNPDIKIQEVTARALARWRAFDKGKQLFDTLERWREEAYIQEIINYIVEETTEKEGVEGDEKHTPAEAIIRTTVALTIAYASTYDKPNKLSGSLIATFLKFRKDESEYVRERFRKVTVPMVVSNHFWQLRTQLPELLYHLDLVNSVAIGIARGYDRFPDRVEKLIDEWLDHIKKHPQYRSSSENITHRDAVLITVIRSLSEIRYSSENSFDAKVAYDIIVDLQKEEHHKTIEKYYYQFVLNQLHIHDSTVDPGILDIIENLSHKRHPKLIEEFTKIYLNQRSAQKGGGLSWRFKNRNIRIWLEGDRPLTEIERIIIGWLLEDHPAGHQIAIDALYQFSEVVDSKEKLIIENYEERQSQNREPHRKYAHQEAREPVYTYIKNNLSSYLIGLITLRKHTGKIKSILSNVLPVLVRKKYTSEDNLNIVASKLRRYDAPQSQKISAYIEKFAGYFNLFLTLMLIAVIVAVVFAIEILFNLF